MNSSALKGLFKASVILGILYFSLYYFAYNKWLNDDSLENVEINYGNYKITGNKDDVKKENISKVDYRNLYEQINYEFLEYNFGSEFFDLYYGNSDIVDDFYLFVSIANLIKVNTLLDCNVVKEIDKKDVDKKINELFGSVTYIDKSFKNKEGSLSFEYDSERNKYIVKTNKCSGYDYSKGGIKNIYYDSYIDGKFLYIREKSLFLDYTNDSFGNIIFNYHEGLDKNSKILSNDLSKINLELLPTYVYKYVYDNGNYSLVSIGK